MAGGELEAVRSPQLSSKSGRPKRSQSPRWGLTDASANFPMALDVAVGSRLVVGYRSPATLAAFDTHTGKLISRAATSCGDADDDFYDR